MCLFSYIINCVRSLYEDYFIYNLQVICTKYPQLSTTIDKILDVYFMLSSEQHSMTEDRNGAEGSAGKFTSHTGRLISTRSAVFRFSLICAF